MNIPLYRIETVIPRNPLMPTPAKGVTLGQIVPNYPTDYPDTIRVFTGNPAFPVSVIHLKHITHVECDGVELDLEDFKPSVGATPEPVKTNVYGSHGDKYTVTRIGDKLTCTCKGFQFRHNCRHLKMV
jgi:hypothetical protein